MSVADAPARRGATIAVKKAGRPITYVRTGDVSTTTKGVATPAETEYSMTGVLTKVGWRLLNLTMVKVTDQMVLIDAASFEAEVGAGEVPNTDDRIKVGTLDLDIVMVDLISSGEQYALHKCVVRR
jgi:hypothetical protein